MRILFYQLVPIVVLLLPLIEAVAFAVYLRRTLTNVWMYGVLGVVVAYVLAIGVAFVSDQIQPPGSGTLVSRSDPVMRADGRAIPESARQVQSTQAKLFEPLTPSWFALLGTIVLVCGAGLWALSIPFRAPT